MPDLLELVYTAIYQIVDNSEHEKLAALEHPAKVAMPHDQMLPKDPLKFIIIY